MQLKNEFLVLKGRVELLGAYKCLAISTALLFVENMFQSTLIISLTKKLA